MIDFTRMLVPHGVTAATWSKRYDIEPFTHPCADCGRPKTTSIPFAVGRLRGLISPPCECGSESRAPYCIVRDPKHGDLLSEGGFEP